MLTIKTGDYLYNKETHEFVRIGGRMVLDDGFHYYNYVGNNSFEFCELFGFCPVLTGNYVKCSLEKLKYEYYKYLCNKETPLKPTIF